MARLGTLKSPPDHIFPQADGDPADQMPRAAALLRDVAEGIASYCGDGVLRHLLEEEWRHAAERAGKGASIPLADLEALMIFIAERIRRDHGLDVLIRLLKDVRLLGETRENVDNQHAH